MDLSEFCSLYKLDEDNFWGLGDEHDFECVEVPRIDHQSRWHTYWSATFKAPDGKFWRKSWVEGSTENQFCEEDWQFSEVVPKQITKTIYVAKSKD